MGRPRPRGLWPKLTPKTTISGWGSLCAKRDKCDTTSLYVPSSNEHTTSVFWRNSAIFFFFFFFFLLIEYPRCLPRGQATPWVSALFCGKLGRPTRMAWKHSREAQMHCKLRSVYVFPKKKNNFLQPFTIEQLLCHSDQPITTQMFWTDRHALADIAGNWKLVSLIVTFKTTSRNCFCSSRSTLLCARRLNKHIVRNKTWTTPICLLCPGKVTYSGYIPADFFSSMIFFFCTGVVFYLNVSLTTPMKELPSGTLQSYSMYETWLPQWLWLLSASAYTFTW